MNPKYLSLMIAAALSAAAMNANASGYRFGSQPVSGQGTADANSAEAADASTIFANPAGLTRLDGILLEGLDQRLAALPPEKRAQGVVLVMHHAGSHGPAYSLRSPPEAKRFLPECTSSHLPDCDAERARKAGSSR